MPMIITKASTPITEQQQAQLTRALGEAIALLPGKSEEWLMSVISSIMLAPVVVKPDTISKKASI